MALTSARMPAPPEGSTPAMVREFGIMVGAESLLDGLEQALFGRTGVGAVELAGDATGQPGFAPRLHGLLHGPGHQYRVARAGDGGIHEHAVAAEFHGDRGVGRG